MQNHNYTSRLRLRLRLRYVMESWYWDYYYIKESQTHKDFEPRNGKCEVYGKAHKMSIWNCLEGFAVERKNNIILQHITHGIKNVVDLTAAALGRTLYHTSQFNARLRKNLLKLEIKITHDGIRNLEKQLRDTKPTINNLIPYDIATDFYRRQSIFYNRRFFQIKETIF